MSQPVGGPQKANQPAPSVLVFEDDATQRALSCAQALEVSCQVTHIADADIASEYLKSAVLRDQPTALILYALDTKAHPVHLAMLNRWCRQDPYVRVLVLASTPEANTSDLRAALGPSNRWSFMHGIVEAGTLSALLRLVADAVDTARALEIQRSTLETAVVDRASGDDNTFVQEMVDEIAARTRAELEVAKHQQSNQEFIDELLKGNDEIEVARADLEARQKLLFDTNCKLEAAMAAAEAANKSKTDFLTNMSHELRTPLTAVLGYTEVLQNATNLDAGQRDAHLSSITRCGNLLVGLIDDLLDVSRIETGNLAVKVAPCAPQSIVGTVVSTLQPKAESAGLTLSMIVDAAVPDQITTDANRACNALMKIVDNAIKFTKTGSVKIMVTIEGAAGPSPRLVFAVTDTGIGLDPDCTATLFEMFAQADTSTCRSFEGAGLGLPIASSIVEQLGGSIAVDSSLGQGSTFTMRIETGPLTTALVPTAAKTTANDKPLTGRRILYVEDGEDNQRLVSFFLQSAGATIELADNGQIGVDAVQSAIDRKVPFDLVLMDMQMPILDGYEATSRLRASGYEGTIVALTAHAMAGDRERCINAGCDGYLTKPINRKGLINAVDGFLRSGGLANAA